MLNQISKLIPKNKKGGIGIIIIFFFVLFIVLFIGVLMAIGSAILNWGLDEVVPEFTGLGMVGDDWNASASVEQTIVPMNTLVQNLTWFTGVIYVLFLIAIVIFIVAMKMNPDKWLIGFFLCCIILLIMGSILISNIYENLYSGDDELGDRLKEQTLLSYMILYSPTILTVLAFICGIILFSGIQREEYV